MTSAAQFSSVTKRYPGIVALRNVSFAVEYGSVTALLGENGAGKSTLLSILEGSQRPDEGHLLRDGARVDLARPADAHRLGMAVIHQEPHLAPHLTVAENILMGRLPATPLGFISPKHTRARCAHICERFGIDLDPDQRVADLGSAQRQMVEIVKALSMEVRVLALDEPTSSLSATEAEQLFQVIHRLRADGVALLYVSHRMEEVLTLSDQFVVLRDGELVTQLPAGNVTESDLVRLMIGREIDEMFVAKRSSIGQLALALSEARTATLGPLSLEVAAGEIIGIAGLMGSGRSRLARAIGGVDRVESGSVRIRGREVTWESVGDSIAAGIAVCPEDRKKLALFGERSISENIVTGLYPHGKFRMFPDRSEERRIVAEYLTRLQVRPADPARLVRTLSGGNAQKIVLARWLAHQPKVLVLDEPTRGIDVGAKSEIYLLLRELAATGTAVIVCSSELVELLGLSDRIYVMRDGVIAGHLHSAQATEESVMKLALGSARAEGRAA